MDMIWHNIKDSKPFDKTCFVFDGKHVFKAQGCTVINDDQKIRVVFTRVRERKWDWDSMKWELSGFDPEIHIMDNVTHWMSVDGRDGFPNKPDESII